MLNKEKILIGERRGIKVSGLGDYDLADTFECGQAFRFEKTRESSGYTEYMTVVGNAIISVGQERKGELIFFTDDDELFENVIVPYFSLNTDYQKIKEDIIAKTDSEWLRAAAESGSGIAILKQDPWETLFSFIISQNNNIPRIKKIIRKLSAEYGENLASKAKLSVCPLGKIADCPSDEKCRECGSCYSFPTAEAVCENPEKLLSANPGFRYRYLCSAAERVASGETNLKMIGAARTYTYTVEELKKIVGVGDKVASCVALFGFANLDAFPIDVWMKRAIDEYFGGKLDPASLGRYAGIAQQYIFHYIRNIEAKNQSKDE